MSETLISVVSPVYGAPGAIAQLCELVREHVGSITADFELILVFDCSPDDGWQRIEDECRKDPRIKGIKLSRNFGQHEAITAGLAHASGKWVVVMDCDLQDRPEDIPALYAKAQEGFDVVVGKRMDRKDSFFKKLSSKLFYKVFTFLSGIKTDATVANFGIYSEKVIRAVLSMNEPFRLFPLLVLWLGFERAEIVVSHSSRPEGKSSYSLKKLVRLAFNSIIAFSNRPLYITILFGAAVCAVALVASLVYFWLALSGQFAVSGFATIVLSVWFMGGATIFSLGVIALYIAKTFQVVKRRPIYVIDKTIDSSTG